MSHRTRILLLGVITVAAGIAVAFLRRVAQPQDYHNFADHRILLSVPNCLNVISNAPFLLAGVWGLMLVLGLGEKPGQTFILPVERWPYLILALGVTLTCFGSAYYHLAPNNARLVWDRLPMTLGFMSLLAAMLMERVNLRAGLLALGPLLILGLASVVYWYVGELHGVGDLRFYLMVQFYTLALILLILWLFPARYTRGGDLVVAMGFYILAKVLELSDRPIYTVGNIVSGHTLKHLSAAIGVYWIFRMLARRQPVTPTDCQNDGWGQGITQGCPYWRALMVFDGASPAAVRKGSAFPAHRSPFVLLRAAAKAMPSAARRRLASNSRQRKGVAIQHSKRRSRTSQQNHQIVIWMSLRYHSNAVRRNDTM